ncbi:MAG: PepSY domain-containing protein [Isosphaeraceae bacterium]
MSESENCREGRGWPDYRAVWRWHFYAGLFCIPFVVVLSISGSFYLFKEEIEAWLDRPYDGLTLEGSPASASLQAGAALNAFPGSTLQAYELPQADDQAVRVVVRHRGEARRVYVHPETLEVMHSVAEEDRPMRILFKLHGELLMGNRGSALVELAASWTIVMVLTGLYLWWPRRASGLGGILYPRLGGSRRIYWRDLHGVTGFWISGLVLFLLLSGLPWAKFWGEYLRRVRRLTGTAVARQDWSVGATPRVFPEEMDSPGRKGAGRRSRSESSPPLDLSVLDRVVATVRPLSLPPPVVVTPPGVRSFEGTSPDWTARSMTANRPRRVDLVIDGTAGAVISRKEFKDRHLIDRIVGTGVAAHEGRLFGWPNQLLGLITAAGLLTLSFSSIVLWWRRRVPGVLGAPAAGARPRFSVGPALLALSLAIYLPLFGASAAIVFLTEKLVLSRIPATRDWLGLTPPAT